MCFCHRCDDIIRERSRVWACEAHTLQAFDLTTSPQKLGKCTLIAELNTVGVDVLAQQSNFNGALVHKCLYFVEHFARATIAFFTAQARDNAERAGVVASHRN